MASDAGDNTIADCTFFKNRYLFDCGRECNNMKYVGNIFEGTLQDGVGGAFFSPSHPTYDGEVIPNGVNSYFKNCDFHNIEGACLLALYQLQAGLSPQTQCLWIRRI